MRMGWGWSRVVGAVLAAALAAGALPPADMARSAESWLVQPAEAAPETGLHQRTLHLGRGEAAVRESSWQEGGRTVRTRQYDLPNGDTVSMGRVTAETAQTAVTAAELRLETDDGTLHWFDAEAGQWKSQPFFEGELWAGCIVVSPGRGGDSLVYTTKIYEPLGRGSVRHRAALTGHVTLTRTAAGWTVRVVAEQIPAGCTADYMLVESDQRLFDWSDPAALAAWPAHDTLDDTGKWRLDGYYYRTPDNYSPSGPDCYYLQPAAYLCEHYLNNAAACRAAWDLAAATLDTVSAQQNVYGYYPTRPESGWLAEDYGIAAGFYDTRFNTDLAETLYRFGELGGCEEFDRRMEKYFDFYADFAEAHHRETAGGGWLVDDYGSPLGGTPTHTSLNHQLAEILALYHYADRLERPALEALADRMLRGVEDTAAQWIRPDGDLHYAVYPDGTYRDDDYPYLTYNDLFKLQRELTARGRPSLALQSLMDAKLAWMRANGVTGYLTA